MIFTALYAILICYDEEIKLLNKKKLSQVYMQPTGNTLPGFSELFK